MGSRLQEIDVAAGLAALLSTALGAASWQFLNADGVSYLDLAGAVREGDWTSFVQSYWSPLYPLLLALVGAATSHDRAGVLAAAHVLNVVVALGGVALIWRRFRGAGNPIAGRLALAAWLLCSARPPRVEALTPDLLLTVLILALALELIGRRRPFRTGLLLGVIFLAKTSSWPWILVVLALESWQNGGRTAPLLRTSLTCAGLALLWIVPLSIKSGTPTIGSAGALNACWYLRACDSRSPDTHEGAHRAYRQTTVGDKTLQWADVNSPRWTYAPWGDPTAWAAGVRTQSGHSPSVASFLAYVAQLLGAGLVYWLSPVLLGVLLPALIMRKWRGVGWDLAERDQPALVVSAAGVVGVAQFFLIHAEPRLIGPYLLCLSIGVIAFCVPDSSAAESASGRHEGSREASGWRSGIALSYAGYLIAIPLGVVTVLETFAQREQLATRESAVATAVAPQREAGIGQPRIVLIGYAFPALADVWRANARIVAQVRPSSAAELANLPTDEAQRVLAVAFAGAADWFWFAEADGAIRMRPGTK